MPVNGSPDVSKTWRHPPVAVDDTYDTPRDTVLRVAAANGVRANDVDTPDDALTASLVAGAQHGTVTLAPDGGFVFVPYARYVGPDGFRYRVHDAFGNEDTADVTIAAVSSAPVAVNDGYASEQATPLIVGTGEGVFANDIGDPLTAILVDGVDHGALVLADDGSFTYEADDDYIGTDIFTYYASDGDADSNTATVTITITRR